MCSRTACSSHQTSEANKSLRSIAPLYRQYGFETIYKVVHLDFDMYVALSLLSSASGHDQAVNG